MTEIKIILFGDSICVGQYVSIHSGWVTKTSARLSELVDNCNCRAIVTNASGNGRTTRQALEVMPYEVQSQHPDILIVQFGMNDCNYWQSDQGLPRVSPKAFAANLEEIIARALSFGVRKLMLNTNHPTGRDQEIMPFTNITYQKSNEKYNQIIREVAGKQDSRVILADIEKTFMTHAKGSRDRLLDLLLPEPDLLHPSEQGHSLYFDIVCPIIEVAVLELIQSDGYPTNERA